MSRMSPVRIRRGRGASPDPTAVVDPKDFARELRLLLSGKSTSRILKQVRTEPSLDRVSAKQIAGWLAGREMPPIGALQQLLTVAGVTDPSDRVRWMDAHRVAEESQEGRRPFVLEVVRELEWLAEVISMRTASSSVSEAPVILYLDDAAHYDAVRAALDAVLDAFNQEVILESEPVNGSLWQGFVTIFKRQATPERVEDAVGKVKAGAEARWYGEPQSQITKAQGEAIASLLTALEGNENALLTFSNILIVKVDGVPLVRELTPEQVEHFQKNPQLYTDPRLALRMLDDGRAAHQDVASGPDQQAIAP